MVQEILNKVVEKQNLNENEMESIFSLIMNGETTPSQIASFITALRMKGETVAEITGAAKIMRSSAIKIDAGNPDEIIDTCGTGGDRSHTFNISTASAIVAASCGVKVAKHGNRSVSSSCGSADVLKELGVNIEMKKETVEKCISNTGIGFLFAPSLHPAMKYAIGTRREIGIRTIFNILGPLTNPANAKRQLLGVYDKKWIKPLCETLRNLNSIKALVVHGSDGLDEITTTGKTYTCELSNGNLHEYEINPQEYGISLTTSGDLKGGDAKINAAIINDIFNGKTGPKFDIVVLNAAACLYVADKVNSIKDGIEVAKEAIKSSKALKTLENFIKASYE